MIQLADNQTLDDVWPTTTCHVASAATGFRSRAGCGIANRSVATIRTTVRCNQAKLPNVRPLPFIDRMDLAYAAADLVIGRAGGSISEMCLVGKPAILVPSPNVTEDHQTKNALALVEKQAALMVKDVEAKERLLWTALEVLDNVELGKRLGENIKQLAKPNAAEEIAKVILKLVQA